MLLGRLDTSVQDEPFHVTTSLIAPFGGPCPPTHIAAVTEPAPPEMFTGVNKSPTSVQADPFHSSFKS